MEKGALLPIKFYPVNGWQDYEKIKNYSGTPGICLARQHILTPPAFQLVIPDIGRHWGVLDFQSPGDWEIVNYATGDTESMWDWVEDNCIEAINMKVHAGYHRNFVYKQFPIYKIAAAALFDPGIYYYHFYDQFTETHWYSEIFELCDLELDAITEAFTDDGGWGTLTTLTYSAALNLARAAFCKTGAAQAEFSMPLDVFIEEELDLYIQTDVYGPPCGATSWNKPLYIELRTSDGQVISDVLQVDIVNTCYHFTLKAEITGTISLVFYVLAADTTKGSIYCWVQRRYTEGNIQLRYSNSENFCKIFYDDEYENAFFFDTKQVIDQQVINEEVTEDDQGNKYRIIGTNQKWNSLQFAGGEAMLNAMSLLRIHDNIKIIRETGEVMDVSEMLMEYSILDYEASLIKLIYREESCSEEACGFNVCCPTMGTPIMQEVYDAPASLPAAGAGNDGWYAMVLTAADQYRIYLSNGAAWAVNTTFDVAGYCVEARQNNYTTNRFFWYDTGASRWRIFIELASVTDNADGTGDLNTDTEYRDGLTIIGEYYNTTTEKWTECTTQVDLTAGGGAIALTTLDEIPGIGTFDFRLHAFISDCDYGYSNTVTQTIT